MNEDLPTAASQDSKNIALLIWIGTIFLCALPGLVVYLVKKDDAFVTDQAKEALNWSITMIIGYVVGWLLTAIFIGMLIIWAVSVANLVICILGAVSCSNGNAYRAPFALRLIK
jgi:uncharacterized Tic20 family protein